MKKFIHSLIVLAICLTTSEITNAQDTTYFKSIAAHYDSIGNYDQAINELLPQLKKYPKNEYLNVLLASLYFSNFQVDESQKLYETALAINPKRLKTHIGLISCAFAKGKGPEGKQLLDKALTIFPDSAELLGMRGLYKISTGMSLTGLQELNKAIEKDPSFPNNYLGRAGYYKNIGDTRRAIADLNKFNELKPNSIDGIKSLIAIYQENMMTEEADLVLKEALKKRPNNLELLKLSAEVSFMTNDFDATLASLTKALEVTTTDPEIHYLMAYALYQKEEMDDACASFQQSMQLMETQKKDTMLVYQEMKKFRSDICDDSKMEYYYQRGIAAFNIKNYEKSLEWHNKGIAKFPANSIVHTFKGNTLIELKRYEEAIKEFRMANADDIQMYEDYRISNVYGRQNNNIDLIVRSSKFTNLVSIGQCFLKLNQKDSAVSYFLKAAEIRNIAGELMGSAEALAGLSLIDLKRYDEAEKQFQQAVNINQSPEVLALLAISQFCQSFDKSALPNTDFALAEDLSLSSFTFDLKAKVKNQEKLTLANSTISKALKLNPEFPIGNYIKGIIEYYSGTESCKYWELATTQKYTVPLSFMKKCSK